MGYTTERAIAQLTLERFQSGVYEPMVLERFDGLEAARTLLALVRFDFGVGPLVALQ